MPRVAATTRPAASAGSAVGAAVCRAYNRWLAGYCEPYPERLFGVAMLPMQSIDLAIEEMRFAQPARLWGR
jgi:uncharacterized protein